MPRPVTRIVAARRLVALTLALGTGLAAAPPLEQAGTRLSGVRVGPHPVGFSVRSIIDPTRHVNAVDGGVRISVASWYPALTHASEPRSPMTALDYHLLQLGTVAEADRRRYEEDEVTALCSWRHIGIVELTREQATRSLHTSGIAIRDAPKAAGTWPVVLLLGGPFYLASTAETLATHGFVVLAPFRTGDQQNEIGTQGFSWYLENAVRDAEWTVNEFQTRTTPRRVVAIGHGGGGLQALLFAMRNRNVAAVVNIDAGNFSTRTNARTLAFYSPRLLRVPYLHMLRADTRKDQDQYDDFTGMLFSRRIEVVLRDDTIRHHDLSDIGRAVAVPMKIRGDAQSAVEREYADVQDTVIRFLQSEAGPGDSAAGAFETWLTAHDAASRHSVKVYPAIEPAPVLQGVLAALDASTPAVLRAAHERDPNAAVFEADRLVSVVARAMVKAGPRIALEIASMARELHPEDPRFLALTSEAALAAGDRTAAMTAARECAALPVGDDWQAQATVKRCQDEVERLSKD